MTVGFDRRALARKRRDKGLSQDDLASLLSVAQQTVSAWERGVATPVHETLPVLAHRLGCTIDDLFTTVDGTSK
jgi:transcriptional regulator with XRE-family HTH domain